MSSGPREGAPADGSADLPSGSAQPSADRQRVTDPPPVSAAASEEARETRAARDPDDAGVRPGDDAEADSAVPTDGGAAGESRMELRGRAPGQPNRFLRGLREIAIIGVIALVISFVIKTFIAQAFWIPTGSMEQTLIRGDRVVVSKITAGPLAIERGDIAVFRDPGGWLPPTETPDYGPILNPVVDGLEFVGLMPSSDGSHLIKRVIGVGGDRIVCCDEQGRISVNGEPLEESYLYPDDAPSREPFDVTVPEDHYWMMGDHRSNSRDSRHHDDGTGAGGAVPADNMVGRAMVLIWPLDRFDWFDGARDVYAGVPDDPPAGD